MMAKQISASGQQLSLSIVYTAPRQFSSWASSGDPDGRPRVIRINKNAYGVRWGILEYKENRDKELFSDGRWSDAKVDDFCRMSCSRHFKNIQTVFIKYFIKLTIALCGFFEDEINFHQLDTNYKRRPCELHLKNGKKFAINFIQYVPHPIRFNEKRMNYSLARTYLKHFIEETPAYFVSL